MQKYRTGGDWGGQSAEGAAGVSSDCWGWVLCLHRRFWVVAHERTVIAICKCSHARLAHIQKQAPLGLLPRRLSFAHLELAGFSGIFILKYLTALRLQTFAATHFLGGQSLEISYGGSSFDRFTLERNKGGLHHEDRNSSSQRYRN